MEDFIQSEQEKIRSIIPKTLKSNGNIKEDKMRNKNRRWLYIMIVLMILTIVILIIASNRIQTKYSKFLGEEYEIGKEIFILQYKDRNVTNELYNAKYEISKLEEDNDSNIKQIHKIKEESAMIKNENEKLDRIIKTFIQEYNDRIILINHLKEQNQYYKNKILDIIESSVI